MDEFSYFMREDPEWVRLKELISELPTVVEVKCGNCGEKFETHRSTLMARIQQSKSGYVFCSRKCGAAYHANAQKNDLRTMDKQIIYSFTVDPTHSPENISQNS